MKRRKEKAQLGKGGVDWRGIALAAVLLVAAVAVEWPALRGGYQWDDDLHVSANRNMLDAAGLWRTWTEPGSNIQYYPMAITAFWLEYRLWGAEGLAGYHLVNMLAHGVNAVLVWLVLRRLGVGWAWLAAAVFAVHPMVVDSVAWISELKTLLAGMFYLAGMLCWLKWLESKGREQWWWYGAAAGALLLGLFSKAVVCTFPVAMLLVEYWRFGKVSWRAAMGALPLLVVGLGLAVEFARMEKTPVGTAGATFDLSAADRVLIAGRAVVFYAEKVAWPAELLTIYPRWKIDAGAWWQWLYPAGVAGVIAGLWGLKRWIGRGPATAAAVFVVTLAPALGFVDFYPMTFSFVADHYAYLAMVPLLALGAAWLRWLAARRWRLKETGIDGMEIAAGVVFMAALAPLAWSQAGLWVSERALWEHTVAGNPESWMARENLADGLMEEHRPEDAMREAEASLAINPDNSRPHMVLGRAFMEQRNWEGAVKEFERATEMEPSALHWGILGKALEGAGNRGAAEEAYRKSVGLDSSQAWVWNNLAALMLRRSDWSGAEEAARRAVALMPEHGGAHVNLGMALAQQGKSVEGARELRTGLGLIPENPAVRLELARALGRSGDVAGAIAEYQRVVIENPGNAAARRELETLTERPGK